MNRKGESTAIPVLGIIMLVGCIVLIYALSQPAERLDFSAYQPLNASFTNQTIKVASWNLQAFGQAKWSKQSERDKLVSVLSNYDIAFVQEIRDESGDSFNSLCASMPRYHCIASSRAGNTMSKEQYGVLYKDGIVLDQVIDYNLDNLSRSEFNRPPFKVTFNISNDTMTFMTEHTDPDNATAEIQNLYYIAADPRSPSWKLVVLGDLNADGAYYDESRTDIFNPAFYKWVITNDEDTTVASSSNTYDRIILGPQAAIQYVDHGIDKGITSDISDHYLVWVELRLDNRRN